MFSCDLDSPLLWCPRKWGEIERNRKVFEASGSTWNESAKMKENPLLWCLLISPNIEHVRKGSAAFPKSEIERDIERFPLLQDTVDNATLVDYIGLMDGRSFNSSNNSFEDSIEEINDSLDVGGSEGSFLYDSLESSLSSSTVGGNSSSSNSLVDDAGLPPASAEIVIVNGSVFLERCYLDEYYTITIKQLRMNKLYVSVRERRKLFCSKCKVKYFEDFIRYVLKALIWTTVWREKKYPFYLTE